MPNERESHLQTHSRFDEPDPACGLSSSSFYASNSASAMLLSDLPNGTRATVERVVAASPEIDAIALRRLSELGFIPGEPLQLLRRGPGGREPLAVVIGETMFALRRLEAQCIEVRCL